MAILSFISIITLIFYFFVKNALSVIRVSSLFFGLLDGFLSFSAVRFNKQKMKSEKSIMIEINVLGLFQTTCRKSSRTWQPEKSNRESFSWFSAPVSGSRHEKGSGITRFKQSYWPIYWILDFHWPWLLCVLCCKNKLGVWSTIEFLRKWNKAKSRFVLFILLFDTR